MNHRRFLFGKFGRVYAFKSQELKLYVGARGIACEVSVCSDYTVAGDDYGNGVVTYCISYGLGGHTWNVVFGSDFFGESAIGCGLSVGDPTEVLPDLLAEGSALGGEGEAFSWWILSGEVEVKPIDGGDQNGVVFGRDLTALGEIGKVFLILYVQSRQGGCG